MWQEGQEGNEDLFDDVSESFVRCALHQGVIFICSFNDLTRLFFSENYL